MGIDEYRRELRNMPLPQTHVTMPRWIPRDPDNWAGMHAERAEKVMWTIWVKYENKVDFDDLGATDFLYLEYLHARDVALTLAHTTHTLISVPN